MLITITGPSAVGKDFVKEAILATFPQVSELVWATTRAKRPGKREMNRLSVTMQEFQQLEQAGRLAAIQEVYREYYGLMVSGIVLGQTYLTELHIANIDAITHLFYRMVRIAITPDSIELLEYRLRHIRKTETAEKIAKRMSHAEQEIEQIKKSSELFSRIFVVTEGNQNTIAQSVLGHLETKITRRLQ